jgi:hypothetical protein
MTNSLLVVAAVTAISLGIPIAASAAQTTLTNAIRRGRRPSRRLITIGTIVSGTIADGSSISGIGTITTDLTPEQAAHLPLPAHYRQIEQYQIFHRSSYLRGLSKLRPAPRRNLEK